MIRRGLIWLGRRRAVVAAASRVQTPIDRVLLRMSRGRVSLTPTLPVLVLHTTGRKSGEPRSAPMFYVEVGDGYAVADTNYGRAQRPGWSVNLSANPSCRVTLGATDQEATGRIAVDEERAALWDALCALWPPYADYAARLARVPHVWVLDRV